jgi:hypothetical protein
MALFALGGGGGDREAVEEGETEKAYLSTTKNFLHPETLTAGE